MDFSTDDVLFVLGGIELAACVGCALYWLIGRGAEARPARTPARRVPATARTHLRTGHAGGPQPVSTSHRTVGDDLDDTGRHHVPDALLQASTYRLSADRRARAKVPVAEPFRGARSQ